MSLSEIEAAVEALPPEEQRELVRFLLARLPDSGSASEAPSRSNLVEFSGVIHLREDPLEWQRRIRDEWR